MEELVKRIKVRYLDGEAVPSDEVITEMLSTIRDRLLIMLETDALPTLAQSIVVDAGMKALRLRGYEGSQSESLGDGGSISNSFVTKILEEYAGEIQALKRTVNSGHIRFMGAR